VRLERSYHVATLDHDAELIFTSSSAFFQRLAGKG
jgi:carboxylesterase